MENNLERTHMAELASPQILCPSLECRVFVRKQLLVKDYIFKVPMHVISPCSFFPPFWWPSINVQDNFQKCLADGPAFASLAYWMSPWNKEHTPCLTGFYTIEVNYIDEQPVNFYFVKAWRFQCIYVIATSATLISYTNGSWAMYQAIAIFQVRGNAGLITEEKLKSSSTNRYQGFP